MLEESYCSKELTKLLLEKGCPLNKVHKQYFNLVYYTLPKDDPKWEDCDAYCVPTLNQAMKWLREQYSLHISINQGFGLKGEVIYIPSISKEGSYIGRVYKNSVFKSYENAVEIAIRYCLEKI